ncbi:hypothetical protein ACFQ0M_43500 [Kitasatospora aburaviensis]
MVGELLALPALLRGQWLRILAVMDVAHSPLLRGAADRAPTEAPDRLDTATDLPGG